MTSKKSAPKDGARQEAPFQKAALAADPAPHKSDNDKGAKAAPGFEAPALKARPDVPSALNTDHAQEADGESDCASSFFPVSDGRRAPDKTGLPVGGASPGQADSPQLHSASEYAVDVPEGAQTADRPKAPGATPTALGVDSFKAADPADPFSAEALFALRALLDEGLAAQAISLTQEQRDKLCRYLLLLRETNRHVNLTAITDDPGMVRRHLLDSLSLVSLCPPDAAIVDVGTGAGLPGVPLAVALPEASVTLLDSLKKRLDFLRGVICDLPLPNAVTVWGRAEERAREDALRESFDVATARAVAQLRVLCEYCLPYVKVGGLFLPMKAGDIAQELEQAKNAIGTLGGRLERVFTYTLPGEGATMSVPVIRKVKPTDKKYPRRQAQLAKKPL